MPRLAALLVLFVAFGCDAAPTLRCPSDRRGASCDDDALADAGWVEIADGGSASSMTDAGSPQADAGGWSLDPPGTPPPDPGCDEASGECDAWEAELVRQIEAARSCSTPLTIDGAAQAIAQRQADYQAEVDRLTSASPDGSLFDQLRAAGSSFDDAGAVFSVTRQGPSDVLARWRANAETAPIAAGCWTHVGAAFSTSTTGASYVTVLFLTR